MSHWGLSPYESFMVSEKSSRRPSGSAVAGLVLGSVGTALAVGAWIFGPVLSNSKANGIRDLANAQFQANNAQIAALAGLLNGERAERVQGDINLTTTINAGSVIASPTNLKDCCQITNAVSLVSSFNVTTPATTDVSGA